MLLEDGHCSDETVSLHVTVTSEMRFMANDIDCLKRNLRFRTLVLSGRSQSLRRRIDHAVVSFEDRSRCTVLLPSLVRRCVKNHSDIVGDASGDDEGVPDGVEVANSLVQDQKDGADRVERSTNDNPDQHVVWCVLIKL